MRFINSRLLARLAALGSAAGLLWACQENLLSGPTEFGATLSMPAWTDTIIVGDVKTATAKVIDAQSREIQNLTYHWAALDTSLAHFAVSATSGNSITVTAAKPGATTVTLSMPDQRFVVTSIAKTLTVVIGGLAVSTSHDTTLTAIGDTARVFASSLVKASGVLVSRSGQGIKWVQKGAGAVTLVGTGDSIRMIAHAPGTDTLIARHDYCLAGARCADTVYARVRQTLKLTLSTKTFTAWTFGDSAGPAVTLADRRGTGNALATVRLVPVTTADSARVTLTATLGTTVGATGAMAVAKMITAGNGTARVAVVGFNPDGSKADSDTITYVIRQIAVRTTIEPLTVQMTELDTVPVRAAVARDSRGYLIGDATLTTAISSGLDVTAGKLTVTTAATAFTGTMLATVSGAALAASNPGAPATTLAVDTSNVTVLKAIRYTADSTSRAQNLSLTLKASGGGLLTNRYVRWIADVGSLSADSALSDASGVVTVTWTPTTAARRQLLTGLLRPLAGTTAPADSSGYIIVRRSVTVTAGVAVAATSSVAIRTAAFTAGDTATVTLSVRDAVANLVTSTVPGDVAFVATGGTIGTATCSGGICTAIYTGTTTGAGSVTATIGGVDVTNSPLATTIVAGAASKLIIMTQPVPAVGHNAVLATQPVLRVTDAYNNTVSTSTAVITASLNQVSGGVTTLVGTLNPTAVVGTVTFTNLQFGGLTGTITITFTGVDGAITLVAATSNSIVAP